MNLRCFMGGRQYRPAGRTELQTPIYNIGYGNKAPKRLSPEELEEHKAKINSYLYIQDSVLRRGKSHTYRNHWDTPRSFLLPSGVELKAFYGFKRHYLNIYKWWRHILRRCLTPEYLPYPYFGGKGISIDPEFMEAKNFCIWALENNLYGVPNCYDQYLIRKDKSKGFFKDNLIITSERELITTSDPLVSLQRILLTRKYDEYHHPTVSLPAFYARYYVFDLDADTARFTESIPTFRYGACACKEPASIMGFRPKRFYNAMADETSCSYSQFEARYIEALVDKIIIRPYDMLKPEYSVKEQSVANGKSTRHQRDAIRSKFNRGEITCEALHKHLEDVLQTISIK